MTSDAETPLVSTMEALSKRLGAKTGLSDEIASSLRNLILTGELRPGDRIVESRVARQLGVGQPTVREALVALEHLGLVSRKANHGCFVTTLNRDEIADTLRLRGELEILAVDLAIENASVEAVSALIEIARDMVEIAGSGDVMSFYSRDREFHEALWALSGNRILPRVLSQVMTPLLAFLFIRNARDGRALDYVRSAKAHVDIAESISTRDKAYARRIAQGAFGMFSSQHLDIIDRFDHLAHGAAKGPAGPEDGRPSRR
ncbi:MAG TPA: GntR family transcriptional regulator [Bryobacteraceae bacterium]|nr:GntR family transcriptional regulator [Bryobacteraceae bacterium]